MNILYVVSCQTQLSIPSSAFSKFWKNFDFLPSVVLVPRHFRYNSSTDILAHEGIERVLDECSRVSRLFHTEDLVVRCNEQPGAQ
jgi:hypothetical protein